MSINAKNDIHHRYSYYDFILWFYVIRLWTYLTTALSNFATLPPTTKIYKMIMEGVEGVSGFPY